jgi:quinol monooxygenase YgiN
LPLHAFVRFEPIPGKEQQLREESKLLLEPTRAESGCIRIHLYQALRDPLVFYIRSEWMDDAASDAHRTLT